MTSEKPPLVGRIRQFDSVLCHRFINPLSQQLLQGSGLCPPEKVGYPTYITYHLLGQKICVSGVTRLASPL